MTRKPEIYCLLMICLLLFLPAAALAAPTEHYVGTSQEFRDAVGAINASDAEEHFIYLKNDVTLTGSSEIVFQKHTTTLLGEGHVLTMEDANDKLFIAVTGEAVLNLGSADYDQSLVITEAAGTGETICSISVSDSGVLNMYANVTIRNCIARGQASSVTLSKNAQFNMYGGSIDNCDNDIRGGVCAILCTGQSRFIMYDGVIENCDGGYGGAVMLDKQAVFTMKNGKILNCTTGGGYGGGAAYLLDRSSFIMEGGEIRGCRDEDGYGGGAVALFHDASFRMTGGLITECDSLDTYYGYGGAVLLYTAGKAELLGGEITRNEGKYGGGVFVLSGQVTIGDQAKLHNNHAQDMGDDIYSNTGISLSASAPAGEVLEDTGFLIDAWYLDGCMDGEDTPRWSYADPATIQKWTLTGTLPAGSALKAAHGARGVLPGAASGEMGSPEGGIPRTGDIAMPALWSALLCTSALGALAVKRRMKNI